MVSCDVGLSCFPSCKHQGLWICHGQRLMSVPGAAAGLKSCMTPQIPPDCEGLWEFLLRRCWEPVPEDRCSMRELAELLQRIIAELEDEQQARTPLLQPMHAHVIGAAALGSGMPSAGKQAQRKREIVCCSPQALLVVS